MNIAARFVAFFFLAAVIATGTGAAIAADPLPKAGKQDIAISERAKSATFVGSDTCRGCHRKDYAAWKSSWHANMHREVNAKIVVADFDGHEISYAEVTVDAPDGKKAKISPTIRLGRDGGTFTMTLVDKDDAANNRTWPIAYVFGGNWNQHFEARVGEAAYPTPMRWIVEDGQWTTRPFNDLWWIADGTPDGRPRRAEEMSKTRSGDATCDGCHTTGYRVAKDKASGRWIGDRVELGIGCESCHGPGSAHADSEKKSDIVNPVRLGAVQQDQLCGQCHSRVTNKQERELSFPTGFRPGQTDLADRVTFWTFAANPRNFWPSGHSRKNRQQLHDGEFSKHRAAGVTCITCHDTHQAKKGIAQVRMEKNALCIQCHEASAAMYRGSVKAGKDVGCVDCHMAKIANRSDPTAKAREHWDASAHTMAVFEPAEADRLKIRSSCDACHSGAQRAEAGASFANQRTQVKSGQADAERLIAEREKAGRPVDKARAALAPVAADRGAGAHNPARALAAIDEALKALAP